MAGQWRQLQHTELDYLQRFVAIMKGTDPIFRGLDAPQVATWLDPNDGGPYKGDSVIAYGWFRTAQDAAIADRMQTVLLGRRKPAATEAELLMIGWAPDRDPNDSQALDDTVRELFAIGSQWLGDLGVSAMRGVQCKTIRGITGKRLKDRLYWRVAVEPFSAAGGPTFELIAERDLGDAFFWRAQLS